MAKDEIVIKPQKGPQTKFLSTDADIIIFGGAAGGGKSWALLLEAIRNVHLSNFGAVIFRRESPQITNQGGLWDASSEIYPYLGAKPRGAGSLDWTFPSGARVKFSHLEHEKNKYSWQGTEIPFIGFDELTHFTRSQFFYLLSRNRSMSGVPGYVRATTNPDSESWVAELLEWWIDQDTGYAIPERDGVVRWFVRLNDEIHWADSKEELIDQFGKEDGQHAKSLTFIKSSLQDNKLLLEKDPQYLANLKALDRVERARLLDGNWKIKPSSGEYFKRSDFEIVKAAPSFVKRIRYWDRAGTKKTDKNNPDFTVGLRMSVDNRGVFYIEHVERFQGSSLEVENRIKNLASSDGNRTSIGLEQDPGQAGKAEAQYLARQLAGHDVKLYPVSKSKVQRATGLSAQAEAGNVKLVEGKWNEAFILEAENFPPDTESGKDDQIDAASGAFNALISDEVASWTSNMNQSSSTFAGSYSRSGSNNQW